MESNKKKISLCEYRKRKAERELSLLATRFKGLKLKGIKTIDLTEGVQCATIDLTQEEEEIPVQPPEKIKIIDNLQVVGTNPFEHLTQEELRMDPMFLTFLPCRPGAEVQHYMFYGDYLKTSKKRKRRITLPDGERVNIKLAKNGEIRVYRNVNNLE